MLNKVKELFNLNDQQISLLKKFMDFVLSENEKYNLTSITNEDDFINKHFIDSLMILKYFDLKDQNVLDFGTGAGFPGIPLAITNQETKFTLVDSNNKKTNFINQFIELEKLTNVNTICSRVEEIYNKEFDFVVSRAVSSLDILLEITCNLVRIGGLIVFYKGRNVKDEVPRDQKYVKAELGFEFKEIIEYSFDDWTHSFVVYKKVSPAKSYYPRHYTKIKSNPIFE